MSPSNSSLIKETTKKLNEINKTVSKLDPAIRLEAYNRLAPMYFGDGQSLPNEGNGNEARTKPNPVSTENREQFFSSLEDKPTANVKHIAAFLYSQHGVISLTSKMIKKEAIELGRIIPRRPDGTMDATKDKTGKLLFRKNGKGRQWTVPGETFAKETYGVKPGKKALPEKEPK